MGPRRGKSGAAWIAHRTRCPRGVANGEVRLARRLRSMPATKAALETGEISADHAHRLARANRPSLEDAFARDEELLVGHAKEMCWADFNRALSYWEQLADPDGAEDDAQAQHDARRAHRSQTLYGTWVLDALLDPVGGAIVDDTLSVIEQELFEADWADAKAVHGDDVSLAKLARTRRSGEPTPSSRWPSGPPLPRLVGAAPDPCSPCWSTTRP